MTMTPDVRLEYLEEVASIILKFKPDKWSKLMGAEENVALFTEFFEKPDVRVLVLTLNAAGMIVPCLGFPESLKSKGVYFIKTKPDNINKDNYKARLLYGDISPTPVDQLIAVVEEVLYSLLNQRENMAGWPQVVSEDIVKQVHRLKNEMFVMSGKIKGKTLLPIPEHLGSLDGTLESMERIPSSLDNSLLHAIETIIIDWSHQIRDVLSKDSAQALLDGLHPLPRVEFEFWDARLLNLKCIHEQLNRPKVNKIVEILEKAKSCYWPALQNVYTNVTEGLKEANDIVLYLKPLRILLEEMEQADFTMLPTFIAKVLDTICFIWATSEYYNTPVRIIVILQEFCNQIIEMTRTFLSPEEVLKGLQGEIEEVLSGISLAVHVLKELYQTYDFCCTNMKLFFKDKEPVPWEFPSSLAFSRMNSFSHRIQTIEELYKTAIEFLKLEKIELGGVRGNLLGNLVTQIYDEVFELVKVFADCKYDPLDPGDSNFDRDYADFEIKIQDLDRRLATIFCQGFEDYSSIESSAKLLYMCGGLLERPLILAEVVPRYSVMLELFDAELDNAKILYDAQMAASEEGNIPLIHKNMPPVAGQLKWSLELQERLEVSMKHLKHIEHPVMSGAEAKLTYQKYDEMMELLRSHREKIYQQWVVSVDQDCHFNLGQPLILRDASSNLIHVNFSKALVAVLREVKYLNFQQQKEIPDSAESLFSENETFRKFVGNLELIVGWYNEIKTTVKAVEFLLIKSELEAIDVKLLSAETTLFWNGEDWSANLLFERKDNKKEALLDLDGRIANLSKRYTAVRDAGVKIQAMVAENAELFRADTLSLPWKDYVIYIDDMVLDEFDQFIRKSLNFLMDNMVTDESIAPLFEIRMELDEDGLTFHPSLEVGSDHGFLALIEGLVNDIYNVARLIPRLAKGRMNYKIDLEDNTELIEMREEVSSLVINAMKEAEEYQDSFERYSYLWTDDPQEFMNNFLIYGCAVTAEDLETRTDDTIPKTPPTLAQFQQQIDSYEKLYEEVSECKNTKVFHGWLQCDCRPFKQALLSTIRRWGFMFKQHLSNHVTNSLADLEAFMKVVRMGLTKPLKEGDYDGLVEVMGHLMKVKERQVATDNMFEPLKQTIELLKTYGEEMPEEIHLKLQELPEHWTNTKKLAIQVKQNVAPLQANEVSILRRKCQQFELKQHEFREKFRHKAPFSFRDPNPYTSLNKQQKSISAMEGIMEALSKSGGLFEVTVPDYKQLKACHREVRLLKELWDMIVVVNTSIEDWKTTKWKDINVEQMDIDCKKFAKDVRSLDKEMKTWDAFVGLDNTVKNMITSLRAVSELQNPAIRERHWQQLMQATQVKFKMSEETTLADLLQLNLHSYEDEVRNIVDKAVKESGMEKVLKALDSTWSMMEFEHEPHPRTGTMMLKSNEVLVETLEDNQVQLQNLMTSKYLAHFLKEVTSWQQKLSMADSVISIWFEVQRTWSHLESIFIGSEDIRAQLPEDSQRFDDIDQEFKALMEDAVKTPNVVEATSKPGLYDKLEALKKSLAICEKALSEYLETKRLAFPRFYFVSSADLLDILSNGNDPVEVSRHLSKLFDSLCKLKFQLDANDKPLKVGLGMYSKEDEYMVFDKECDLSGQVEVWLNRVLDRMCSTLRHEIPEAVVTYEEKPREQWILDYPAQVALTCTQIWWTTEVGLAFARLEEGYENAIKDYNKKQISQLNVLITLLIGNLNAGDRMKIMTICTIDVHARDVVAKMIVAKVESSQAFTWQAQLRHRWDEEKRHCFANICDAQIQYSYEYLGNTPRLVITPLTDRCYITLTQSLHLIMGGAPAGPAGTGKTETTKDLGRALGTMVYVFNCSEQMDYKSCGNIYKGLAQTGAWGCFDEFNRISVEVLSVIAVQVKCVQDAIRAKKKTFNFLGEIIGLIPTVGIFITMNPGYAGRTELPENLKALFRPCAMVVPDFELICEIMLVAEGFLEARLLARKFITLYTLCKELLSKQDHYDWGLRAIKSVLVVAGSLKRGDPSRAEDQVLMRALRDFNIPKIVTDDLPVFMGLIGDLFPALDVPRKRDLNFEKIIKQSIVELKLQAEDSFVLKVVQLEELLQVRHSVFVIGNAGSGKSQVLKSLNKTYQNLKRKPVAVDLDPKAVTCDELFGIINPATREWKDYDRHKLTLKDVHNCQYVACMNPTSGSFTIDPRLQRHFCVFAVSFPGQEALTTIYNTILTQHLAFRSVSMATQRISNQLVAAALALHQKVAATFLPTAIKFHYVFNLRDLSSIFQGLLFSTAEVLKTPLDLVRLWLHEAERVYGDKMVDEKDQETLHRVTMASTKKFFDDLGDELLFAKPNIFCHFAQGIGDPKYVPVTDVAPLNKLLMDVLDSYNEINAVMNLVLFEDAVAHICRINRILESPRGNALLVGVGGSGKQSLSRLAAYISGLDVFQITLKKGYGIPDLKVDLAAQYIKAAVKNIPSVFLMTDSQVAEEQFLVLINDLLASGEIPGLFVEDEVENIVSSMRPQVKSLGMNDTREVCWKFFIEKVRRQLKVILCFSPVGSVLRVRARKFPAVVNCTAIDWFHEWPEDALVSVSARFLEETEGIPREVKASISLFMSYVHTTVNEMSRVYLATERRYNYTTPKTFLEQIKLYQNLLAKKRMELVAKIERLENGLMKLQSTASQVDDLKAKLAIQEAELKQKNESADKLIQVVGIETEKVSKEKAIADEEEVKVEVINKNVTEKQKACETDLAKAEPALLAAQEALDTLNKNNLTELKSFGSPPDAVVNVTAAVMILTAPGGKIPKDKSWKAAKIMMGKVDTFLDSLKKFDKEHIPEACLKAFKPYQGNPTFDPEFIRSKSTAAAGLCSWCINIVRFYEVYCDVAPKRQALEEANAELAEAQEKLSRIKNKIAELNANLSNLTSAFEKATAEKIKCQQEADATNRVILLANRLVGGLASENVRWAESVENFRSQGVTLCGDVLLISAFVSYVGYFTKKYRNELMEKFWIPYIHNLKVPIPITNGLDPLSLLTDDADVATWNNQGLPSDRMSTENATILCNTERWPLIVDAQLQGIKWIKNKYSSELKAIRLGQKSYLDVIEQAISEGDTLLIENIGETVDPVLDPLLGRNTIKKGKYIKIGDKEVEYHPKFRLILHTKYFNPHYKPEMQAQCTLINFLVTRDGLEDQLLAAVVAKERPDLEQLKANLTKSQNEFKIILKELEDSLLARLSAASGNFLGDTALVENLETTKHTASEIEAKVVEAKITEVKINEARENYRPAAERASLLYFILNDLNKINPIYQFSLKAFNVVFEKAIQRTTPASEVKQRVINLTDEITYSVYMYTARGLFERDKLIFLAQVTFQVLSMKKELNPVELDFLLRFPFKAGVVSPVDFLQHQGWGGIKALSEMDEFKNLDSDIEGSAKRWKKLVESEAPEKEIFPKEWKNKTALQKLCMVRCMRPDRMTYAVKNFVEEKMGSKFVEGRSVEFSKSYEESSPSTPIFFILSPGVDPLKDVEALGKKLGFTIDNGKLHNVSLGQGQEVVAEDALDVAAEKGHWVILQNIHLVARWLGTLDKKLERYSTGSHEDYRVFISAEPAPSPDTHIIPQGILENAIKITNEPPTGMHANLHKALDLFTQDTLEMCTKEMEFKCILFALCYFHAVVAERRKFGAQGWNRSYPFNNGDLTISINVLYNYLEANPKVPWDDLRYLFGEIMYGGHITDDWDRRLCRTYLAEYIRTEMLEGDVLLAPGFQIPPNLDYKGYHEYIDENLPPESPYLYGLHPNAEIGFLTVTSEKLFRTVLEMQPKETDSGAGTGVSREEKVKAVLDDILEKIPETFNMAEIMAKAAEKTPYVVVAFQECERMNILTNEMRRSLKELNLGLKGELTITTDMEDLSTALFYDTVPDTWVARAYPSMMGLAAWYADLLLRIRELEAWTTDFALPTTVWLAGFFNPQSFLTAIMQSMARKNEWPLDKMCLSVEVTKKNREDMTAPPREGSYVYGLFMEGARWDTQTGVIADARLKELTPAMPVIFIKAIPVDRMETKNVYECPVYKTRIRGPTYVWTFNLKTKEKAAKWVLAAVALLLQV
uniref:Dynein axonemal heavy chain 17 n=1 Tax=Piliocolobus tephrosceles TaxID=591936 RepID=A0A8C9IS29_9PRIM